jgi:hypothetical protein
MLIFTVALKHCIVTTHKKFKGIQEEGIHLSHSSKRGARFAVLCCGFHIFSSWGQSKTVCKFLYLIGAA